MGGHEVTLELERTRDFHAFMAEHEPILRAALVSRFGFDVGREATAEAMAYAWQHWDRLAEVKNKRGYLFRVGQTAARRTRRPFVFAAPSSGDDLHFEPGLASALGALSERQRTAVVLAVGYGLSHAEVASLLGVSRSSIQNHVERGMASLRRAIKENRA